MKKDPFSKDKATNRRRLRNGSDVKTISDFKLTLSNVSENQVGKNGHYAGRNGKFQQKWKLEKCQIQMCTIYKTLLGIKNSSDSLINRLDTGEERNNRLGSKERQREIIQNETKE